MTNMQKICTPTLLMLPSTCCCKWAGSDSDGCYSLPGEAILQWHGLWQRLCRLVFSKHWTKIRPICLPRRSCACTDTLRTTGY